MSSMINQKYAELLLDKLTLHGSTERGTLAAIIGRMGSGKTSLLYFFAQIIRYKDRKGEIKPETVVMRGRPLDLWLTLLRSDYDWYEGKVQKKKVKIWFHYNDVPQIVFDGKEIVLNKEVIGYYGEIPELYKNLIRGGINIIYEPRKFELNQNVIRLILQRSFLKDNTFEEISEHDPNLWWYEFLAFVVYSQGDAEFVSVIWDEADDIIPSNSVGLRYHLQAWLKDVTRDLRKCKISLYIAAHNYWDLDFRIFGKIVYHLWLTGAMPHKYSSLVTNKDHFMYLPIGTATIERGQYGTIEFPKMRRYSQCTISFVGYDMLKWLDKKPEEPARDTESIMDKETLMKFIHCEPLVDEVLKEEGR